MQRTLKRESKVLEIVERETIEASPTPSLAVSRRGGALPLRAGAPGDVQPPSRRPPRAPGGSPSTGVPRPCPRGPPSDRGRFRRPGGSASAGNIERREKAGRGVPRAATPRGRTASRKDPPRRPGRGGRRRTKRRARSPSRGAGGLRPHPRAARRTLTQRLRPTRLETRTKESNARASVVVANQNPGGPPGFPSPSRGGARGTRWNAQRKRKRGIGLAQAGIPPPLSAGEAPSTDPELPPPGATPGDRNERFE